MRLPMAKKKDGTKNVALRVGFDPRCKLGDRAHTLKLRALFPLKQLSTPSLLAHLPFILQGIGHPSLFQSPA